MSINTKEKYYERRGKSEIPTGAIRLTLKEVSEKQWDTVLHWKPRSEMWPLIQGPGILGGLTILTGSIFLKRYRKFFTMARSGVMATFVPTVGLTAAATMFLHHTQVTNELLTGQLNCATCAEVRALSIQLGFGCLYPLVMSPVVTIAMAKKNNMYAFPPLTDFGKVFALVKQATKPLYPWIVGLVALQIGVTIYIVHKEGDIFAKIMKNSQLEHVK